MIPTNTEKTRSMIIDSQAPLFLSGEAVNTKVYLHQRTPNEGLTTRDNCDGYQAAYPIPYEMLQSFGKPSHNNDGNEISYKAPFHLLQQVGCYANRLIPKPQRHGKLMPKCTTCMMVGYVHNWTTLWRIWDPAFREVWSQSDVIFDKERNTHSSCLHGDETDIFEVPEETEYFEEIETGGDGLLHYHAGTSRTGAGHWSGDYDCTDNDTDHNMSNADNHRSLPASTGVRSGPPDEEDASPVSKETIDYNRHLHHKKHRAHRMVAMTMQSCQPSPRTNRITRSQVNLSANEVIILPMAHALTLINSDPFTYAEAIDSPQWNQWERGMEEECTSILLNSTFTTINFREVMQLRIKPIGSRWVYKKKHNPNRTIPYKLRLSIERYKQTDFGETYAPVGKLTTFWYLISLVGK